MLPTPSWSRLKKWRLKRAAGDEQQQQQQQQKPKQQELKADEAAAAAANPSQPSALHATSTNYHHHHHQAVDELRNQHHHRVASPASEVTQAHLSAEGATSSCDRGRKLGGAGGRLAAFIPRTFSTLLNRATSPRLAKAHRTTKPTTKSTTLDLSADKQPTPEVAPLDVGVISSSRAEQLEVAMVVPSQRGGSSAAQGEGNENNNNHELGQCCLTAKTRDNQCALHGSSSSLLIAAAAAAVTAAVTQNNGLQQKVNKTVVVPVTKLAKPKGLPTWPVAKAKLNKNNHTSHLIPLNELRLGGSSGGGGGGGDDGHFGEQSLNGCMSNLIIGGGDVNLAKCLLDQDYNQTVRLFLHKSALNWNFNAFTFDALCCGRSLTELLIHLFDFYHFRQVFQLDIVKLLKCFRLLEFGYHSTNPYHNSLHAADVTQAMHCFIQEQRIRKHMTQVELLSSILAAVCHDLDHPGVNQSFLIATGNPLAQLYNRTSVLENHHWHFALSIFKEARVFDHFEPQMLADMQDQLKQLILATDIARQDDYLKRFKELTQTTTTTTTTTTQPNKRTFSMTNAQDRALVLQMALKCADLGNPCRPWLISRVWSNLICEEFYRMGSIERQLNLPLTPICQRHKTSIARIQTDFFKFIVLPLLELWHGFLGSPLSRLLMTNFEHNYQRWQRANRIETNRRASK